MTGIRAPMTSAIESQGAPPHSLGFLAMMEMRAQPEIFAPKGPVPREER